MSLYSKGLSPVPDDVVPMHKYRAALTVLRDRERELLELKGPCRQNRCRLHRGHFGPCHIDYSDKS